MATGLAGLLQRRQLLQENRTERPGALRLGAIQPTLPDLSLEEAAWMLQGLYLVNLDQLDRGVNGINQALILGRVKYNRRDEEELWQPIRKIWLSGSGDCEDLAAAVAAELTARGILARPVIYRVRPGLAHAVVEVLDARFRGAQVGSKLFGHPVIKKANGNPILDPSRTGGMGRA